MHILECTLFLQLKTNFNTNDKKTKSMKEESIIKQVCILIEGEKAHKQSRIVEIETTEHRRRGLLRGYIPEEGVIVFS